MSRERTEESFALTDYSKGLIIDNKIHYIGVKCDKCERTANVPTADGCWFCVCGHCNPHDWNFKSFGLYDVPNLGPSQTKLNEFYATLVREPCGAFRLPIPLAEEVLK